MEIIKTKFKNDLFTKTEFIDENSCFLDIETTGLNRNRDIIYLIGILYLDKTMNSWVLDQIFANSKEKEKDLLLKTMEYVSEFDEIINYNGNSFDIPFINQRLKVHSIDKFISRENSLDIYSLIRSNRNIFDLPNLRLKTIEEYLGIFREDIYSGRDCIQFYYDYLLNGDPVLKDRILQHNYDDLYYLIEVMEILDIILDKKTFQIEYQSQDIDLVIDSIDQSKDYLILKGETSKGSLPTVMHYGDNYKILIEQYMFEISIEIKKGLLTPTETCFFIDMNDYGFSEDMIIESNYKIPSNIILIQVDKIYRMDNIKKVLTTLINNILN